MPTSANTTSSAQQRVLIFVVAYNAKTTLAWVLDRIPQSLHHENVEVLVIDDSSQDDTFRRGVDYTSCHRDLGLKFTVLRNPENQGYGGNQKLGYRYALDNHFDVVALMHGDGQYAPEKLPDLLAPLLSGEADAVFGSRMLTRGGARQGGMPAYKFIGNKVLTTFQNRLLGTSFSEFHSGYRLYSTKALRAIPFERNTNDFHFDTEIIVQLVLAGQRVLELPIPTYYGDEVCRVNGMKYAWDVCKTMFGSRLHQVGLCYDRRFDVSASAVIEQSAESPKLGYTSSHMLALDAALPGGRVLNIGGSEQGDVAGEIARCKGCRVTGMDRQPTGGADKEGFIRWNLDAKEFPVDVSQFDQVFLLDVIEHLKDPEHLMEELREAACCQRPEIVLSTANVGFFVTRLMLLLGQFNYGRRGILDRTHTRLFTFRSLRTLLQQTGYKVLEVRGVPAPFPRAIKNRCVARLLLTINEWLIKVLPGLFSYQIFVRAQASPSVRHLLVRTLESSDVLRRELALL